MCCALDPLNVMLSLTESVMLAYARDFDTALSLALGPIELIRSFQRDITSRDTCDWDATSTDRAASLLERGVELSHRASWPVAKLGCALMGLGRMAEARTLLDELEQRAASDPLISAPAVATLHLHVGDHTAFYRWMHRGLDERDPFALSLNGEFLWDAARHEPAFHELMCRVGLANAR